MQSRLKLKRASTNHGRKAALERACVRLCVRASVRASVGGNGRDKNRPWGYMLIYWLNHSEGPLEVSTKYKCHPRGFGGSRTYWRGLWRHPRPPFWQARAAGGERRIKIWESRG